MKKLMIVCTVLVAAIIIATGIILTSDSEAIHSDDFAVVEEV